MKIPKLIVNLFVFILTVNAFAQELTILSGEPFFISNNTVLHVNGLSFLPSSDFNITGPNAISRSSTAIDSESINRVFTFDNTLSDFEGTLILFYEDTELNGLMEGDLLLKVKNEFDSWNEYPATRDTGANTLTYTFASAIDYSAITAGETASLGISDFALQNIHVFPNPTNAKVFINADFGFEVSVYNLMGQLLLNTNQRTIDLSNLNSGSYIFTIRDLIDNGSKSFKIIKK
jgi:hypothetical protein